MVRRTLFGAILAGMTFSLLGCTTPPTARERIVVAGPRCEPTTLQIYFDPNSAEVTPEGLAVIEQTARRARGCVVQSVKILGLADASGAPQANLDLSKRRAHAVIAALASSGLPAADFEAAGLGDEGAQEGDGSNAPLRRRVDVALILAPAK